MAKNKCTDRQSPVGHLVRFLCFVMFSTTGMVSIGMAILAGPVAGYYADRAILQTQQKRIEQLQDLYAQQEELLANAGHPGVITRAADNLGYLPNQAVSADLVHLPEAWPELEDALTRLDQPEEPQSPHLVCLRRWAETLSEKHVSRIILLALGGALVLMSLTCFNRPR